MRPRRGGEDDPERFPFLRLSDLDPISYARPDVMPDEPVYPDVVLAPVLPVGAPDLGGGDPPPLDLDDVTGREPQGKEGVGVESGDTPGRVVGVGLGHLELNLFHVSHLSRCWALIDLRLS